MEEGMSDILPDTSEVRELAVRGVLGGWCAGRSVIRYVLPERDSVLASVAVEITPEQYAAFRASDVARRAWEQITTKGETC
jgi:GTP-dependent phosphoenolpyruvate carboxykinase